MFKRSGQAITHCWNIVLWNCTLNHNALSLDFYYFNPLFNILPKSNLRSYSGEPVHLHSLSSWCTNCMYFSHYTTSMNDNAQCSSIFNNIPHFVWESNPGWFVTHDLRIPGWNIELQNYTLDHNTLSEDFYSYNPFFNSQLSHHNVEDIINRITPCMDSNIIPHPTFVKCCVNGLPQCFQYGLLGEKPPLLLNDR